MILSASRVFLFFEQITLYYRAWMAEYSSKIPLIAAEKKEEKKKVADNV